MARHAQPPKFLCANLHLDIGGNKKDAIMKKIIVNAASQEAVLYDGDSAIRLYVVSTAKNGLGCGDNSLCTPNGKLRIAEKIGDGLPIGTILRGGEPTKGLVK